MLGVNLSQNTEEEESSEPRSLFDTGIIISLGILVLSGVLWGGVRLYIGSLDKKIANMDAVLSANTEQLKGAAVDRVADFDARLKYFTDNKGDFSDPQEILKGLENVMVPGVVLTKFEYDHEGGAVILEGSTEDFRKLAEQVLGLKSGKLFSTVMVDKVARDDNNRILFTLKATL